MTQKSKARDKAEGYSNYSGTITVGWFLYSCTFCEKSCNLLHLECRDETISREIHFTHPNENFMLCVLYLKTKNTFSHVKYNFASVRLFLHMFSMKHRRNVEIKNRMQLLINNCSVNDDCICKLPTLM